MHTDKSTMSTVQSTLVISEPQGTSGKFRLIAGLGISIFEYRYTEIQKLVLVIF